MNRNSTYSTGSGILFTKAEILKIKKDLLDKKILSSCACDFKIIGDLTRMKICYLLCKYKELSVSDIAALTGFSLSTISHSLRTLKKCCLVASRRDSKYVFYRLQKTALSNFLQTRLAR